MSWIIKNCPCCGGTPRIVCYPKGKTRDFEYFTDRYAIQCEYSEINKGCGLESGHYKTIPEAVESWNKRDSDKNN